MADLGKGSHGYGLSWTSEFITRSEIQLHVTWIPTENRGPLPIKEVGGANAAPVGSRRSLYRPLKPGEQRTYRFRILDRTVGGRGWVDTPGGYMFGDSGDYLSEIRRIVRVMIAGMDAQWRYGHPFTLRISLNDREIGKAKLTPASTKSSAEYMLPLNAMIEYRQPYFPGMPVRITIEFASHQATHQNWVTLFDKDLVPREIFEEPFREPISYSIDGNAPNGNPIKYEGFIYPLINIVDV